MTITWIELKTVLAIHDFQISAHGGAPGVRDIGLIESALNKPKHMLNYGSYDIIDLAAAYGFSLVKNHGFIDGNKRTAYVVTRLFLKLHRMDFKALPVESVCFKPNQAIKRHFIEGAVAFRPTQVLQFNCYVSIWVVFSAKKFPPVPKPNNHSCFV